MTSDKKQKRGAMRAEAAAWFAGLGAIFLVLIMAYSLDGRQSPTVGNENPGWMMAKSVQMPVSLQETTGRR